MVACNLCEADILVYQKGGRGNLIKLQFPRIIESEFKLDPDQGALICPFCQAQLGSLSEYKGNPTYYLIRGLTNSQRLSHYKMPWLQVTSR